MLRSLHNLARSGGVSVVALHHRRFMSTLHKASPLHVQHVLISTFGQSSLCKGVMSVPQCGFHHFHFRSSSSTTTFYDSQSGKHITVDDIVRLYTLSQTPSENTEDNMGTDNSVSYSSIHQRQYVEILLNEGDRSSDIEKRWMENKFDNDMPPCVIANAFSVDILTLQTSIATLCDCGVDHIMLADCQERMMEVDDDDIIEAIEAAFYVDIEGKPMRTRLGLRCSATHVPESDERTPQALWQTQFLAALHAGVRNFDVDVDGKCAPTTEDVRHRVQEEGFDVLLL